MTGSIAETASNANARHAFGGTGWSVQGPPHASPAPVLLLSLDLSDPALELTGSDVQELPLCSRVDGDSVDPQVYRFDPTHRIVTFEGSSWNVKVDPRDALPSPLPRTPLQLRPLAPAEDVEQTSIHEVQDTFLGGNAFLRIRGEALWLDDPEEPACSCGRYMELIACIGYENFERPSGLVSPTVPFFLGELALYFFACLSCRRCVVVTQPG